MSDGYLHVFCIICSFYMAAPLSLCCNIIPDVLTYWEDLIFKFIARGKAQMPLVEYNLWEFVIPLIKLGWRHWIGTAIFLWGWIHQHRCHKILVCISTLNILFIDKKLVTGKQLFIFLLTSNGLCLRSLTSVLSQSHVGLPPRKQRAK